MEVTVPAGVGTQFTSAVAHTVAEAFTDDVIFPDRVVVDTAEETNRLFPGGPASVLVLAVENQGVCAWGVPLGLDDPPVLVGGDLEEGECTLTYVSSINGYIAARLWDRTCLNAEPLVQAQADPIDAAALKYLHTAFQPAIQTRGWPSRRQFRLERGDVRLLLWSGADRCDWWISGPTAEVACALAELRPLSNLEQALWSNDEQGQALLGDLGVEGPW